MPTTSLQSNFTCRRHSGAFLITYIKKRYHFKNVTRFSKKFQNFPKIFSREKRKNPEHTKQRLSAPHLESPRRCFPAIGRGRIGISRSESPQRHPAGVFHVQVAIREHDAVELGPGILNAAAAELKQNPVGTKGHGPQGVILHAVEHFLR